MSSLPELILNLIGGLGYRRGCGVSVSGEGHTSVTHTHDRQ